MVTVQLVGTLVQRRIAYQVNQGALLHQARVVEIVAVRDADQVRCRDRVSPLASLMCCFQRAVSLFAFPPHKSPSWFEVNE